jgi:hypothetical protein
MICGAEHKLVYYVLLRCAGQRVNTHDQSSILQKVVNSMLKDNVANIFWLSVQVEGA